MARPLKRHLWAEQVFQHIPSADSAQWISLRALASQAGLTSHQVLTAVAYLRDNYPEFPLVSSRDGYRFSIDEEDVARFRQQRARSAYTTVRRLWRGAIHPYLEHAPLPSNQLRQLRRDFKRVMEEMADIV